MHDEEILEISERKPVGEVNIYACVIFLLIEGHVMGYTGLLEATGRAECRVERV